MLVQVISGQASLCDVR